VDTFCTLSVPEWRRRANGVINTSAIFIPLKSSSECHLSLGLHLPSCYFDPRTRWNTWARQEQDCLGFWLRVGGSRNERDQAKGELYNFIHDTLDALIHVEKKRLRTTVSSLEHFARVDISVIEKPDGSFDYFVNEIERGLATTYFMSSQYNGACCLMDDFIDTLIKWVDSS
jgi:hypothetical protein